MTGSIATDLNENNLINLLLRFYVPEDRIRQLLKEKEPYLLIAVIEWLMNLRPGFKNLRVITMIASTVKGRDHAENVNYFGQNECIPQLPTVILEKEEIEQFFAIAQDILECESKFSPTPTPS